MLGASNLDAVISVSQVVSGSRSLRIAVWENGRRNPKIHALGLFIIFRPINIEIETWIIHFVRGDREGLQEFLEVVGAGCRQSLESVFRKHDGMAAMAGARRLANGVGVSGAE